MGEKERRWWGSGHLLTKGEKRKREKENRRKRRKEVKEKRRKGEKGEKRKRAIRVKEKRSPLSPYPNGASAYAFSAEMEYR